MVCVESNKEPVRLTASTPQQLAAVASTNVDGDTALVGSEQFLDAELVETFQGLSTNDVHSAISF